MHKHKTLAVLEALMKWEDKLLGRKVTVVTNHKGLEYFKTQLNLLLRQTRWWEYLSHFNCNTIHVDGMQNQVADSFSCYYEYNTIEDGYPNREVVCKLLEVSTPHIPLRLSKHLRFVPSIIWLLKLLEFSNLIHIS